MVRPIGPCWPPAGSARRRGRDPGGGLRFYRKSASRLRGTRQVSYLFLVPDTRLASFAADLRRQCQGLNGAASEAEVLGFTEEAAGQVEGWT